MGVSLESRWNGKNWETRRRGRRRRGGARSLAEYGASREGEAEESDGGLAYWNETTLQIGDFETIKTFFGAVDNGDGTFSHVPERIPGKLVRCLSFPGCFES